MRPVFECVCHDGKKTRLNVISIKIGDMEVSALLATGASCSLINDKCYKQLKEKHTITGRDKTAVEGTKIKSVDNRELKITGRMNAVLSIAEDHKASIELFIVKTVHMKLY